MHHIYVSILLFTQNISPFLIRLNPLLILDNHLALNKFGWCLPMPVQLAFCNDEIAVLLSQAEAKRQTFHETNQTPIWVQMSNLERVEPINWIRPKSNFNTFFPEGGCNSRQFDVNSTFYSIRSTTLSTPFEYNTVQEILTNKQVSLSVTLKTAEISVMLP